MKIILNEEATQGKNFFDNNALMSYDKEYEVISVIHQYFGKLNTHKVYKISYVLLSDDFQLIAVNSEECTISDNSLDDDFIYEYVAYIKSYVLHPKSLSAVFFYNRFAHNDLLEYTKDFCERFRGLLPKYKYAECFKNKYQDPDLKITAEPLGDNWVLCPECNEAFEVDKNQGVVTCPNVACKTKMNNPYAPARPVNHENPTN